MAGGGRRACCGRDIKIDGVRICITRRTRYSIREKCCMRSLGKVLVGIARSIVIEVEVSF